MGNFATSNRFMHISSYKHDFLMGFALSKVADKIKDKQRT
jgi:hypothetical protein